MLIRTSCMTVLLASSVFTHAQAAPDPSSGVTSLTIYNQNFAVARTLVDLDLKQGNSEVTTSQVTSLLEPDSVVLRDPTGKNLFSVIEQNYDAAVVNQEWMLEHFEGKTIDFNTKTAAEPVIKKGTILRASPPLIQMDGAMQFALPGTPLFPANTEGLLLKPTLRWKINSSKTAHFPAELSYVTQGFGWSATYNLVAAEGTGGSGSETMNLVGWVTMTNTSGVNFPTAHIQLMAGDVAKVAPVMKVFARAGVTARAGAPAVTQESFDDFHLYDLNRTTSLSNGETKQVEFLNSPAVSVRRIYQYDGAPEFAQLSGDDSFNSDRTLGLNAGSKVTVSNEFVNSEQNHLGVPLPAGRLRIYRLDKSGAMQFAGEAKISHTPRNETIRFVSGAAFDITGKRTQTAFHVDTTGRTADESFSIEVMNRKDSSAEVQIIEHLYRGSNATITQKSTAFQKQDSSTVLFPVSIQPQSAATITYTVHYTW